MNYKKLWQKLELFLQWIASEVTAKQQRMNVWQNYFLGVSWLTLSFLVAICISCGVNQSTILLLCVLGMNVFMFLEVQNGKIKAY